jgi:hypothetical protein
MPIRFAFLSAIGLVIKKSGLSSLKLFRRGVDFDTPSFVNLLIFIEAYSLLSFRRYI